MDRCPYSEWPQSLCNGWVILRNEQDWRAWVDHGRPPKFGSTALIYRCTEDEDSGDSLPARVIEVVGDEYQFRPGAGGPDRKLSRSKSSGIMVELLTNPGRAYTYVELDTIEDTAETRQIKQHRDDGGAADDEASIDAAALAAARALDTGEWRRLRDATADTLYQLKDNLLGHADPAENNSEAAGLIQALIDLKSATTTTATPTRRLAQRVRGCIHTARQKLGPTWCQQHGVIIQNQPASSSEHVPGTYAYHGPAWTLE